jgi:molecular chaperone GrpE
MGHPAEESTAGQNSEGAREATRETTTESEQVDESARHEDRWRRAVADLDNLRKRFARELDRERSSERSRVAAAWLPIVDNLERAIGHAGGDADSVIAGVRATLDQAVQLLEQLGYERDTAAGVPFDPERHEVFSVVEQPDTAPGTVVEVMRPGYGKGSSQLRPAAVAVSGRKE